MKKIIVFHEKHGDRYFDASTDALLNKALRKILNERIEQGGWYEDSINPEAPEEPISQDDFDKMKEGALKEEARKQLGYYKSDLKEYRCSLGQKDLIDEIRVSKKLDPVLEFFNLRRDYEYEGFDIETLEKA